MFENGFPREWSTIKKLALLFRAVVNAIAPVLKTVTGAIIHITDALAKPVQALSVKLEPIQAGSGDPSPDNVRPISGWDAVKVTRTGKNLFDPSVFLTATGWTETDGVYSGNSSNIQYSLIGYLLALPNFTQQITLSFRGYVDYEDSRAGYFRIYYADGTSSFLEVKDKLWKDYTLTSTAGKVVVGIGFTMSNSRDISLTDFQVEIGSSATAYSPYVGTTYPIPLGQTVYGGQLDVVTGVLTVDRAIITPNVTSVSAPNTYGIVNCSFVVSPYSVPNGDPRLLLAISNVLGVQSTLFANTEKQGFLIANRATAYLRLLSADVTDVASANAWVSDNNCRIVYYLETPTTIQLTPTQVELLQGENNIWSDGTMTLVYLADGNVSEIEALNILLGGQYSNNHGEDEPTDREALNILLGGNER